MIYKNSKRGSPHSPSWPKACAGSRKQGEVPWHLPGNPRPCSSWAPGLFQGRCSTRPSLSSSGKRVVTPQASSCPPPTLSEGPKTAGDENRQKSSQAMRGLGLALLRGNLAQASKAALHLQTVLQAHTTPISTLHTHTPIKALPLTRVLS